MKRAVITGALIGALTVIPFSAKPWIALPPTKPKLSLVECTVVLIVVGVGTTIVYGIYKMCKRLNATNAAPHTNTITDWPSISTRAYGDSTNVAFQSSPASNGPFNDEFSFTFQQSGYTLTAVAYRLGVPVLTNSSLVTITNGEGVARLDFSALTNYSTNIPSGQFYRLSAQ